MSERNSEDPGTITYYGIVAPEKTLLIKPSRTARLCHIQDTLHLFLDLFVLCNASKIGFVLGCFNIIGLEIWSSPGYCTQKEDCVEVDVRQSVWMRSQTRYEALQVGTLESIAGGQDVNSNMPIA